MDRRQRAKDDRDVHFLGSAAVEKAMQARISAMQDSGHFTFEFQYAATDADYDAITRELPFDAEVELDSGLTGLSVLKVVLGSALLRHLTERTFEALCRRDSIREIKVAGPNLKIEVRDVRAQDLPLLLNFIKAIGVKKDDSAQ